MYYNGDGVEQNYDKAFYWFNKRIVRYIEKTTGIKTMINLVCSQWYQKYAVKYAKWLEKITKLSWQLKQQNN